MNTPSEDISKWIAEILSDYVGKTRLDEIKRIRKLDEAFELHMNDGSIFQVRIAQFKKADEEPVS